MPKTLKSKDDLVRSVMLLARTWAYSRSKDPKTKVGAAIYTIAGNVHLGYNGFPKNVPDWHDVWHELDPHINKHDLVIHAEANAIRKALKSGDSLGGAIMCVTLFPCIGCIKQCASVGLTQIIYADTKSKTPEAMLIADALGITLTPYTPGGLADHA